MIRNSTRITHRLVSHSLLALLLLTNSVNASDAYCDVACSHIEIQAFAGASWLSMDNTTLGVTEIETDALRSNNDPARFMGGAGIGYVFPLSGIESNKWVWFKSIAAAVNVYAFNGTMKGDVWQFETPELDNYDYTMRVESIRTMLDASLSILAYKQFEWLFIGGIGPSWNEVTYKDKSKPGIPTHSNVSLKEHQSTNFTWEIGTGFSYSIWDNFNVRLTYLYTDFGKLKTSHDLKNTDTLSNSDINPASFKFYTNSVLLGLAYSFK